jgi:hypothetical protein
MSSNHQFAFPRLEAAVPFNAERMVNFIDRFTAMVVEKLQRWEKDRACAETTADATAV